MGTALVNQGVQRGNLYPAFLKWEQKDIRIPLKDRVVFPCSHVPTLEFYMGTTQTRIVAELFPCSRVPSEKRQ